MKVVFTSFLLFLFWTLSFAQSSISFQYVHAIPQGVYAENLNHNPGGIGIEYARNVKGIQNLQIGGLFNVAMYQNETYKGYTDLTDSQNIYLEADEDDCYYIYQGLLRYYLNKESAIFRPYAQLQAGGITYFSDLNVSDESDIDSNSETSHHGTTWLAGLSVGSQINIADCFTIQLALGYNTSGLVSYRSSPDMVERALYRMDLSDFMFRSDVDHVSVQIGLMMGF